MMNFKLVYHEFPAQVHDKVHACVMRKNNHVVILVDSLLPKDQQEKSLKHELAHLWLDHFIRPLPTDAELIDGYINSETLEAEADRYAAEMSQEEYEALMQWAI